MPRYPGLTLRVLGADRPAMGPGRAALLSHIARTGSITSAARAMGMSYRRAWQLVESMNRSFAEPVVVTEVGGRRGGGAVVTALGKRLVKLYRAMENKASSAIATDLRRFSGYLRNPAAGRAGRRSA